MNLFVFGLGYSVRHFLRRYPDVHGRVAGTVRAEAKADEIRAKESGVEPVLFADRQAVEAHLRAADSLLVSIPPGQGDPALERYHDAIQAAPKLKRIVYLSTIGVYGDHGGAWIDEDTPPAPVSGRNRARVVAEHAWLDLARADRPVSILRLAGIYGPGRSPLDKLRAGTARRIVKPGQVFNRIHVEDIAQAIAACLRSPLPGGLYNVTDNEPAPPQEVTAFAAQLLEVHPPPEIPFEEADFDAMARSFWSQNKRVSNRKLREELGVQLAFPTYREGLRSLVHPSG